MLNMSLIIKYFMKFLYFKSFHYLFVFNTSNDWIIIQEMIFKLSTYYMVSAVYSARAHLTFITNYFKNVLIFFFFWHWILCFFSIKSRVAILDQKYLKFDKINFFFENYYSFFFPFKNIKFYMYHVSKYINHNT